MLLIVNLRIISLIIINIINSINDGSSGWYSILCSVSLRSSLNSSLLASLSLSCSDQISLFSEINSSTIKGSFKGTIRQMSTEEMFLLGS